MPDVSKDSSAVIFSTKQSNKKQPLYKKNKENVGLRA
jgi:hypothetical protein